MDVINRCCVIKMLQTGLLDYYETQGVAHTGRCGTFKYSYRQLGTSYIAFGSWWLIIRPTILFLFRMTKLSSTKHILTNVKTDVNTQQTEM